MKCLVTGCAGFIGSTLSEKLIKSGYNVIGIDSLTDYYPVYIKKNNLKQLLSYPNFKFIKADLVNFKNLNKVLSDVGYIFHEAAQAGVRASWGNFFKEYTDNNILATQSLLEAAIKAYNIKKIIFAGSSSVYGDTDKLPMVETSMTRPVSPYGATKLAAENLCFLYYKNYNIPVVSLRYFTVFGPKQRPDMGIHKFIRAILEDKEIIVYGSGTQTRDFTYVDDIVNANISAMNAKCAGEIINVGGGTKITVRDLLKILEELSGKKAKIKYIASQKGDVKDTLADITKARRILNYKPLFQFKKGLEKEIEWIEKQLLSRF